MTMLNSADYYISRHKRERDLANGASNPAIAAVHREMAERYEQLILSASFSTESFDEVAHSRFVNTI